MSDVSKQSANDRQQLAVLDQPVEINSPRRLIGFAETLKRFIAERKLYTTIGGKAYVHVEAWQFAGAAMGIVPVVTSSERVMTDDPNEIKYRASVELHRIDNDQIVGAGYAYSSNTESRKRNFEEYAVASMAQTRAVSKAFRNVFGWLMKVSGYEATPYEEMEGFATS
jgi:hypothetical protein